MIIVWAVVKERAMCCVLIHVRTIVKEIAKTLVYIRAQADVVTTAILRALEVVRAGVTHHVLVHAQMGALGLLKEIVVHVRENV